MMHRCSNATSLEAKLRMRLWRILLDAAEATRSEELLTAEMHPEDIIESLSKLLEEDLLHFAQVDPASHHDPSVILDAYSAFACVLHYRLAHAVLIGSGLAPHRRRTARWLADQGKMISGIDIHPAAAIGRRFVVDHAVGTVIGETSEIGNDCYVLGGVVLGARGIAGNPSGKRHPKIGNNVQIGSFARILGPVVIGDNAFIAAHCVVTGDVPAGSRVNILNQLQVHSNNLATGDPARLRILGAGVIDDHCVVVGLGFTDPKVDILDADFRPYQGLSIQVDKAGPMTLRISILGSIDVNHQPCAGAHIRIRDGRDELTIIEPSGLLHLVDGTLYEAVA